MVRGKIVSGEVKYMDEVEKREGRQEIEKYRKIGRVRDIGEGKRGEGEGC